MTNMQEELVQGTFGQLVPIADTEAKGFYGRLTELLGSGNSGRPEFGGRDWVRRVGTQTLAARPVVSIDQKALSAKVKGGQRLPCDTLVPPNGLSPLAPPIPGATRPDVLVDRTIEELRAIRRRLCLPAKPWFSTAVPTKPYLGSESLGGFEHFHAVYADLAGTTACCHAPQRALRHPATGLRPRRDHGRERGPHPNGPGRRSGIVQAPLLMLAFAAGALAAAPQSSEQPGPSRLVGQAASGFVNDSTPKWLSLSGEFRFRFEDRRGLGFNPDSNDAYGLARTRVNIGITPSNWLQFGFQGQDSRAPGIRAGAHNNGVFRDTFHVRQA